MNHANTGVNYQKISKQTYVPTSSYFPAPTWLQRVLDVEHGGPVAIHQALLDLIFCNVTTPIFYSDACFQVVEVAAVELKELDKENANVDVGIAHIFSVMELENTI